MLEKTTDTDEAKLTSEDTPKSAEKKGSQLGRKPKRAYRKSSKKWALKQKPSESSTSQTQLAKSQTLSSLILCSKHLMEMGLQLNWMASNIHDRLAMIEGAMNGLKELTELKHSD